MPDDVDARLTALEERLAALEGRTTAARPAASPDDDVLWALNGLRDRAPDESGAVLFAGTVGLPTGGRREWQWAVPAGPLMDSDWSDTVAALSALAHAVRLRLLREILAGKQTVAELGAQEGMGTTGQLYHHLRQLVSAGWLRTTARGQYEVPGERVVPLLVILAGARR